MVEDDDNEVMEEEEEEDREDEELFLLFSKGVPQHDGMPPERRQNTSQHPKSVDLRILLLL